MEHFIVFASERIEIKEAVTHILSHLCHCHPPLYIYPPASIFTQHVHDHSFRHLHYSFYFQISFNKSPVAEKLDDKNNSQRILKFETLVKERAWTWLRGVNRVN